MAFKTFAPGVLTSSDVNTFLMQQAVITCTSSTRPSSPIEGMTIYETDTNLYLTYTGSTWSDLGEFVSSAATAYTPIIASYDGSTIGTQWQQGNGTVTGYYQTIGRLTLVRVRFVIGSTTTIGTTDPLAISLPFNRRNIATYQGDGGGIVIDVSTGNPYQLFATSAGLGHFALNALQSSAGLVEATITSKPMTWQTSDDLQCTYMFERA